MKTKPVRIVRNNHLSIIGTARSAGKIVTEYVGGEFMIRNPGKTVATVYRPNGEVYRVNLP